ncbi:hypothetical protein B0H19DRAFT_1254782 [Mycena capillaripes]|nr:hypothetical protein B0H19DRAFT_1254782 [Mycena capillaripes]
MTTTAHDDNYASDSASSYSGPRSSVSVSSESPGPDRESSPGTERYHPYHNAKARPKGKSPPKSNRRMWNHALERPLFNILELTTLGLTQRRPIYIASLEAHIDRLHTQLLSLGTEYFPIDLVELEHLKGLNSKICKAMIASLHNDIMHARERLLELQRSNETLAATLGANK